MAPSPTTVLDHVVILLPHRDILSPPAWITDHFRVSPGGKHADGLTENRLCFFADGSYIELIAFNGDDSSKRRGYPWDTDFGIVDFALTTREETGFDHAALQERLKQSGCGVSYAEPREGGRVTPEKQELKWKVTFPEGIERGKVPFWCHDMTPRVKRVPAVDGNTRHPCGAVGVAEIVVEVAGSQLERLNRAMSAITDNPISAASEYSVRSLFEIGRMKEPTISIRARPADSDGDFELRLVVQCPGKGDQAKVEQSAGSGTVRIDLVG